MSGRSIVPWPHQVLRTKAEPVGAITPEVLALWSEMIAVMEAMPGVGLAGPQIGVSRALAVVDASQARGQAVRMANPVVLRASDVFRDHEEASPNLPFVSATIRRPEAVTVGFLNADGAPDERDFTGLWSVSVQHQIDHLAGRMYFDHLSAVRRRMLIARSAKLGSEKLVADMGQARRGRA